MYFRLFIVFYCLKIELEDAVESKTTTLLEPFPNQESALEINFIDHTSSNIKTSVVMLHNYSSFLFVLFV